MAWACSTSHSRVHVTGIRALLVLTFNNTRDNEYFVCVREPKGKIGLCTCKDTIAMVHSMGVLIRMKKRRNSQFKASWDNSTVVLCTIWGVMGVQMLEWVVFN